MDAAFSNSVLVRAEIMMLGRFIESSEYRAHDMSKPGFIQHATYPQKILIAPQSHISRSMEETSTEVDVVRLESMRSEDSSKA
jgi:hypothetical protein